MNREIKFRGINNFGEWVYGYYVSLDGNSHPAIYFTKGEGTYKEIDWQAVDLKTVGQFTGLKDNTIWSDLTYEEKQEWQKEHDMIDWKGKEIYEGDIVFYEDGEFSWFGIVEWHEESARYYAVLYKENDCLFDEFVESCVEIKGNIHQNPELLNQKKGDKK